MTGRRTFHSPWGLTLAALVVTGLSMASQVHGQATAPPIVMGRRELAGTKVAVGPLTSIFKWACRTAERRRSPSRTSFTARELHLGRGLIGEFHLLGLADSSIDGAEPRLAWFLGRRRGEQRTDREQDERRDLGSPPATCGGRRCWHAVHFNDVR